jgi:hypothetical protein
MAENCGGLSQIVFNHANKILKIFHLKSMPQIYVHLWPDKK